MAHVFRPILTKAIPPHARISVEDGVRVAVWKNRRSTVRGVVCESNPGRCRITTEKFWIQYTDHLGQRRRIPAYKDRKGSEHLAADIERQVERIIRGVDKPGRDPRDSHPVLSELAVAYRDHLKGLGRSDLHCENTLKRLNEVLDGMHLLGMEPARADARGLARWLALAKTTRKWTPRTRNLYAATVQAFGRWLTTPAGGEWSDPFPAVGRLHEEAGRTIRRRALTEQEFTKLITVTLKGPVRVGLTGDDRAGLYLLAAYTGYRIGELARLSRSSFLLDARGLPVAAVLAAKHSKRRVDESQPIPAAVRPWLAAWLKRRPAEADANNRLFEHPYWTWVTQGALMIRADLAAAKIPHEIGGRRVDFHALRTTYVTNLARAGVPLQHAQKLARHSTPTLTANIYTQVSTELSDQADRLPGLPKKLG